VRFRNKKGIRYFQKGVNPRLLILRGTHGNEFHILPKVTKVVQELMLTLPDFVFIPEVSPSAVTLQSRKNAYGNDINRGFGQLSDPEVDVLKEIMSTLSHVVAISFHEDLEFPESFYFYDTHTLDQQRLERFRAQVKELGVPLFSGIDSPEDSALSYPIKEGYVDFVGAASENGQFIEDWALNQGYFSRFFTFEIPHKYSRIPELLRLCIQFSLSLL